jgi:hypothetical protein
VVEAHRGPTGLRVPRARADREEAEVVIVGGTFGLQERGLTRNGHHDPEAEGLGVEADAAIDVANVENGVVEALDRHW